MLWHNVSVVEARIISGTSVVLVFDNGTTKLMNLRPMMVGPIFDDIFQRGIFSSLHVDKGSGTIVWDNGADLAPEVLFKS